MRPAARNAPCPCGTGRRFKGCCEPILNGQPADSPESLMRSRYTAYATGAVRHLLRTTDPGGPHFREDARAWGEELRNYCALVDFVGLEVHEHHVDGDAGTVRFTAHFVHAGAGGAIEEHSRFRRVDGDWLYLDGEGRAPDA